MTNTALETVMRVMRIPNIQRIFKNIAGRIYEDRKPESVLDVGCAMGYLVEALRDLGVEAYGVDVSSTQFPR